MIFVQFIGRYYILSNIEEMQISIWRLWVCEIPVNYEKKDCTNDMASCN